MLGPSANKPYWVNDFVCPFGVVAPVSHKVAPTLITMFRSLVALSPTRSFLSLGHLIVIIVISSFTRAECTDSRQDKGTLPPPPPPPKPHRANIWLLVLVVPVLLISITVSYAGWHMVIRPERRATIARIDPPPAAEPPEILPLRYPPPSYLSGLPQRHFTLMPILYTRDSLFAEAGMSYRAQSPPRQELYWTKPDLLVAIFSAILTSVGLVLAGLALQHNEHR